MVAGTALVCWNSLPFLYPANLGTWGGPKMGMMPKLMSGECVGRRLHCAACSHELTLTGLAVGPCRNRVVRDAQGPWWE